MRIWSLDPGLLDRAALVAGWRETLLAQKVLRGLTKGYRNHPQLTRFAATADPVAVVAAYLHGLADEADSRGYTFDRTRIAEIGPARRSLAESCGITVTTGQLAYELAHLRAKCVDRAPDRVDLLDAARDTGPAAHPLFTIVDGPVEPWEIV